MDYRQQTTDDGPPRIEARLGAKASENGRRTKS